MVDTLYDRKAQPCGLSHNGSYSLYNNTLIIATSQSGMHPWGDLSRHTPYACRFVSVSFRLPLGSPHSIQFRSWLVLLPNLSQPFDSYSPS